MKIKGGLITELPTFDSFTKSCFVESSHNETPQWSGVIHDRLIQRMGLCPAPPICHHVPWKVKCSSHLALANFPGTYKPLTWSASPHPRSLAGAEWTGPAGGRGEGVELIMSRTLGWAGRADQVGPENSHLIPALLAIGLILNSQVSPFHL